MTRSKRHSRSALVGAFDILGLKRLMRTTDLLELSDQLECLIQILRGCGEEPCVFEVGGRRSSGVPVVLQASDSFVVFSDVKSDADVVQLLWNVHHLIFHAIQRELPIRGAIAYGEALVQTEPPIFIGPAVAEAFEWEKRQAWAGACLAPSLESHVSRSHLGEALFPLVVPYALPLHEDRQDGLAVNWTSDAFYFMEPSHARTKFRDCPASDPDYPRVMEKVNNTVQFLDHCLGIKREHGYFLGPTNRRVVLGPVEDRYRLVRIVTVPNDIGRA